MRFGWLLATDLLNLQQQLLGQHHITRELAEDMMSEVSTCISDTHDGKMDFEEVGWPRRAQGRSRGSFTRANAFICFDYCNQQQQLIADDQRLPKYANRPGPTSALREQTQSLTYCCVSMCNRRQAKALGPLAIPLCLKLPDSPLLLLTSLCIPSLRRLPCCC